MINSFQARYTADNANNITANNIYQTEFFRDLEEKITNAALKGKYMVAVAVDKKMIQYCAHELVYKGFNATHLDGQVSEIIGLEDLEIPEPKENQYIYLISW